MTGGVVTLAAASAFLFLGCQRPEPQTEAPAATDVAPARSPGATGVELDTLLRSTDLRVEARRGVLEVAASVSSGLRGVLDRHHGGSTPYPLSVQAVTAGEGRRALLLQAMSYDARPLVAVVDSSGEVVWTKVNPMGGVKPGAMEAAIASGPDGHIALAWCNPSTGSVALRQWAEDGGAFAAYEALHFDVCESLSALYWPGKGWLLAVASPTATVLSRLTPDGAAAWGRQGIVMPWTFRGAAPVALSLDTPDSFFVVRLGQSGGPVSPEFVFVSRHSPDGIGLWPGPLSVKRLDAPSQGRLPRPALEPAAEGCVRATLPASFTGTGRDLVVTFTSDGAVQRSEPP